MGISMGYAIVSHRCLARETDLPRSQISSLTTMVVLVWQGLLYSRQSQMNQ